MNTDNILLILTFVVVLIVVMLADNLTTALLVISLLVNFVILSSQLGASSSFLGIGVQDAPTGADKSNKMSDPLDTSFDPNAERQPTDMYGPFYNMWDAYKTTYNSCYDKPRVHALGDCAGRGYNIDNANMYIAQRRSRDKKAMDGWAVKDANFYKYHYGSELDNAEYQDWWGRHEY